MLAGRGSAFPARRPPGRLLAAVLLPLLWLAACGDDKVVQPDVTHQVFHATPDGSGPDGPLQECLDRAAPGDTIEFAAGIYRTVADTLVETGDGPLVANMVARNRIVLRAAPGADVRIDGEWQAGRVGIMVPPGVTELEVIGLRFDNCDPAIFARGGRLEIVDCTFVSGIHGLVAHGADLDVRSCRFEEYANEAVVLRDCAGSISSSAFRGNGSAIFAGASRDLVIEDVLVAFACFAGIRVEEGGTVEARGITILGAGMVPEDSTAIVVAGGAHLALERAVVAENRGFGIDCRTAGTADVRCSDFFHNTAGNYAGCADATGSQGNLAVDPLFCSLPDLDFHLQPGSQAATAACGPMGAYGNEPCALRGNSLGWAPLVGRAREHDGPDKHQDH